MLRVTPTDSYPMETMTADRIEIILPALSTPPFRKAWAHHLTFQVSLGIWQEIQTLCYLDQTL